MHEVRSNGNFLVRFEDEAQAQKWVEAHPHLDGISVEPGRAFELHCENGFIDSFHSEDDAKASLENWSKAKKRDGSPRFATLLIKSAEGEPLEEVVLEEEPEASELPTEPATPEA